MISVRDKYITAYVAVPFQAVLQQAEDLSYQTSQYWHQLARSQGDDTEQGKASRMIADQYDLAAKEKRMRKLTLIACHGHEWDDGRVRANTSYEFTCKNCCVTVIK